MSARPARDPAVDAAARVLVDRMLPGNWAAQSEGVRDAVRGIAAEALEAADDADARAGRIFGHEVEL